MLNPCMPPLPPDVIARAQALSCSLLLDGAKAIGLFLPGGGCLPHAIRPVNPAHKMAGTALTVRTQIGDNRPIHLAIYGAKQPGYALVIDGHAHEDCAYMGDLMMGACKALGFAGVVINGYIRDWDGVTVCSGDLVMGDRDGVCVIPREHVEAVLEAAEKRKAYEEARQAVIDEYVKAKEAGETLPDLTPAWAKEVLERINP